MDKLRIDKWLWAVRLFKTRTASTNACEAGRVKRGEDKLKASSKVLVGDQLVVRINHINRVIQIENLIEKRVGAAIAQTCYKDLTPPEDLIVPKVKSAFLLPNAFREKGAGRPTKKERRDIEKFSDFRDFLDEE